MDDWDSKFRWTTAVLCLVGLFKELQPSKPFLVDYAVDHQNFTSSEMIHEVLPATTYGHFVSLLLLVFITDFLRYKPIIILGGVASVACWCLTIWWYDTVLKGQIRQVMESIYLSTEVAYFTYMYANVDRSHYRRVTSFSHAALHLGRFLGGVTGQVLVSTKTMDISRLNYVTLAGVSAALLVSLFLPTVRRSIYFDTRFSVISSLNLGMSQNPPLSSPSTSNGSNSSSNLGTPITISPRKMGMSLPKPKEVGVRKRVARASRALVRDFKIAYKNRYVLKWSLWWSLAQAIYLQVGIYAEPLWKEIEEETHESIYNGVIDASHAILSAILAIFVVFIRLPMLKWGEIYIAAISLAQGAVLLLMSQTHYLYVAYACYILFQTMFQVVIIIATAEVAESVKEDSEAFIFGLNTLFALVVQTILTYAVVNEVGFDLDIREEFVVYAGYLGVLGLIFLLIAIQRRSKLWEIQERETALEKSAKNDTIKKRLQSIDIPRGEGFNDSHAVERL